MEQASAPNSGLVASHALTDITEAVGLRFVHEPGPPMFFFPEIMGSGVALIDYDQDGDLDIYLVNGTAGPPHPRARPDTPRAADRLFRQESDGRFSDVTEQSGLGDTGYGMGVAAGDVNNDGYPDVYVANFGGDRLYLNRRNGTFSDVTATSGLVNNAWASSATFLDFDRDGRLDLFVTNYVDYSNPSLCRRVGVRMDYCHPSVFPPTRDQLYRNLTDAEEARDDPLAVRFEDVSDRSRIASQEGPGLGVRAGDFDDDGWPDLYVANDATANFLWINQRDGTFSDQAIPFGAAYNAMGRPEASMGVAEGDVDGDGRLDLLLTHLRGESNTLYRRLNAANFEDATATAGLRVPSLPNTGFGVALADLDHDGDLDAVWVNGRVAQLETAPLVLPPSEDKHDADAAARFWIAYAEPNQLLINDGRGRFRDASSQAGDFAKPAEVSRGLAVGDLDADGDLDLVVSNTAGPARVYRNDVAKEGHWLMLRVVDPSLGGRDAYGAVVTVTAGGRRWLSQVQPGSSYQSSGDPRVHLGIGAATQIDAIDVRWPDGASERFPGGPADTVLVLRRGAGSAVSANDRESTRRRVDRSSR